MLKEGLFKEGDFRLASFSEVRKWDSISERYVTMKKNYIGNFDISFQVAGGRVTVSCIQDYANSLVKGLLDAKIEI